LSWIKTHGIFPELTILLGPNLQSPTLHPVSDVNYTSNAKVKPYALIDTWQLVTGIINNE